MTLLKTQGKINHEAYGSGSRVSMVPVRFWFMDFYGSGSVLVHGILWFWFMFRFRFTGFYGSGSGSGISLVQVPVLVHGFLGFYNYGSGFGNKKI